MKTNKQFIFLLSLCFLLGAKSSFASEGSCAEGLIWNDIVKDCLNNEDDSRIKEKQKMCDSKAEGKGKDDCNEMVQSFDKDPEAYVETSNIDLSKNEKNLKKIGTAKSVVSAGIAAYKLFEAYNAAKSVKDVFSNMCISGMMSIATGVMSFMNDKNMDDQVKETLKASKKNLDALIAQNEKTKGTTYEMQIKLMEAYKQILLAGAQAAQIREDGYKQEVSMYSISLAIAAIEAIVYAIPPNVQMDKVKCAGWVAGSATVSLVLGTKMKNAAAEAKEKYNSEAEKLGQILKKYMDFFNKKHIDQTSLAMTSAIGNGSSAPINAKTNNGADQFSNKNLTEAEVEMCSAAPSTDCCDDSGKKCPTFNLSIANPTVSSAIGKSGLSGALDRASARLNGDLNLGDSGVSLAIDKDLKRASAFKQRVLKQLKDQGRLTGAQAELFDEKKQMKAFLKKQFGNENAQLASSFANNMALADMDRVSKILDKGDVPKELKADKKKLTSSLSSIASLGNFNNGLGNLEFEDDDLDSKSLDGKASDLALNSGLDKNEEYVYDQEQIVAKPEVSIFQVISNRYNVLRINKRFGQRSTK